MIVIGSANQGKVVEIAALPAAEGLELCCVTRFGTAPEIDESGDTFIANAILKAQDYSVWLRNEFGIEPLVIAEDAGLQVDALDGWPGIHSARIAETNDQRIALLLQRLEGTANRSASFTAVTALAKAGKILHTWEGSVSGRITTAPRGTAGFGYDPVFEIARPPGTFAELGHEVKSKVSHRTMAWTRAFNEMRANGLLPDRRALSRDISLI